MSEEMRMLLTEFLTQLSANPEKINFADTIATIDAHYHFTVSEFFNGELHNEAGQNSGSCKLFSFAKIHNLTKEQTLQCFGDYYRVDVLQHPTATDHQNIRNFMRFGWEGIKFSSSALTPHVAHIEHYKATTESSPEMHAEYVKWLTTETVAALVNAEGNSQAIEEIIRQYLRKATAANLALDEIESILGVNEPSIMDLANLSEADEETVINIFEQFSNN